MMKVKAGDTLTFKGVAWDDGWDFDAPIIVYTPIPRMSEHGSICETSIEQCVEDICIDLCLGDDLSTEWSESYIKEFEWRGWNPKRFGQRESAVHATIRATFKDGDDGMLEFDLEFV